MADQIPGSGGRVAHWESVYERSRADSVSWYQTEPIMSLELVDLLGIAREAGVIDVGGGESVLVDALLHRGFADLNVLDISEAALQASREHAS